LTQDVNQFQLFCRLLANESTILEKLDFGKLSEETKKQKKEGSFEY